MKVTTGKKCLHSFKIKSESAYFLFLVILLLKCAYIYLLGTPSKKCFKVTYFKMFPLSPVIQGYYVQAHEQGSKNKNRLGWFQTVGDNLRQNNIKEKKEEESH